MDIHHVPGRVIRRLDVVPQLLRDRQMREHMLRGEVRRRAVVIPAGNMHLQVPVGAHRSRQPPGHIHRGALELLVGPRLHLRRNHLVRQVVDVAQLMSHVVVQAGRVGPEDRVVARVLVVSLGDSVVYPAGEPSVQPPDDLAPRHEQLGVEAVGLQPQIGPQDVVGGQAGEVGQPFGALGPLRLREPIAARQRPRVVARGVVLCFAQDSPQRLSPLLTVVMRDSGEGGQEQRGRQIVVVVRAQRAHVQHARDKHDPVAVQAELGLQVIGQGGGPQRAVGLAGQELR